MDYLLVFVGGFCLTLLLSNVSLNSYVQRECPHPALVILILLPLTLVQALGGGVVGLLVYTVWRNPDPRIRWLCLAILLLLAVTFLVSWAFHRIEKQRARKREAEEEYRCQVAHRQEARFLADYARLFEAIRAADIEQIRALLLMGMPYTRPSGSPAPRYEPAMAERTLVLRRQDDPTAPLFTVSPLEAAVRAGNAEVVKLLLDYEGADPGKAQRHQRALAVANARRSPELAALIRQYDERPAPR